MSAEDVLEEFFVKITAIYKEQLKCLNLSKTKIVKEYDTEKIAWTQAEGKKGPYKRYPAFQQKPLLTVDYVNLLNDLKNHGGKLVYNGMFYWLCNDHATIGCKPAK